VLSGDQMHTGGLGFGGWMESWNCERCVGGAISVS
jgi:hypothetical protein